MNKNKGFTLIELLVVIAIIGILASVVLASLNTARAKGADVAVKSNLNNIRAQAELVYDTAVPNSYATVCTTATVDPNVAKGMAAAISAGNNGGFCYSLANTWVAWAGLKGDPLKAWCTDNTGSSLQVLKSATSNTLIVCPVAG